jgi:hypothetical protein
MAKAFVVTEVNPDYEVLYFFKKEVDAKNKLQDLKFEAEEEESDSEFDLDSFNWKSDYVYCTMGGYAPEYGDAPESYWEELKAEVEEEELSGAVINLKKAGSAKFYAGTDIDIEPASAEVFSYSNGEVYEKSLVPTSFSKFVGEGKTVTLKRQYTEKHPAVTAGQHAKIRNRVLEAIADGTLTKEEFERIVSEVSDNSSQWARRNKKYFTVSEDGGISLSSFGKKILNSIKMYEGRKFVAAASKAKQEGKEEFDFEGKTFPVTVKETPKVEETFVYESFASFVASTMIAEAFKSTKLANLFAMGENTYSKKDLAKAFYSRAQIQLDQIQDFDLIEVTPDAAYKAKGGAKFVFYISDVEKENPYAPYDTMQRNKVVPGGGYLLGITDADNNFYGTEWARGLRGQPATRTLKRIEGKPGTDSVGINKTYKGYDATGLYNAKRISEVADRAIILDMDLLRQRYSTANIKAERAAAKQGATAFKTDKEFKDANMARYNQILTAKAMELPLDKIVLDAIDTLSTHIKDAVAAGKMSKYNELLIGTDNKGRDVKVSDAANLMRNILDDYSRYCNYLSTAEEETKRYGSNISDSYYKREAANYAKNVTDRIAKIENKNYAW